MAKDRSTRKERGDLSHRDLPSELYHERIVPPEFVEFYEVMVRPEIGFGGYKVEEKRRLALHIIHNLVVTGMAAHCVADSRDTGEKGIRQRVHVWNDIIKSDLATLCLGSEHSGQRSRYRATPKLLDFRETWELRHLIDLDLARNTQGCPPVADALVVLLRGKMDIFGRPVPLDKQGEPLPLNCPSLSAYENLIERINRNNTSFGFQAFRKDEDGKERVRTVDPRIRQVHSGVLFRATRLYGIGCVSGQQLSKDERRSMLIGGEPVAELDYSCMATRMLYHRKRLVPDGDLYRPTLVFPRWHGFANVTDARKDVVRGFLKTATNICWNVTSRRVAQCAVQQNLNRHAECDFLKSVLRVDELTPNTLLDRLMEVHEPIRDQFFCEVGLELMTEDGKIMLHILETFADEGKPALAIHDSLVVRVSDVEFAQSVMDYVYTTFIGPPPVIMRVF
jgi:hypothetical protein